MEALTQLVSQRENVIRWMSGQCIAVCTASQHIASCVFGLCPIYMQACEDSACLCIIGLPYWLLGARRTATFLCHLSMRQLLGECVILLREAGGGRPSHFQRISGTVSKL